MARIAFKEIGNDTILMSKVERAYDKETNGWTAKYVPSGFVDCEFIEDLFGISLDKDPRWEKGKWNTYEITVVKRVEA